MPSSASVFSNRGINIIDQFPALDSWSQFSPLDFLESFGDLGLPSSSSLLSRDNSAFVNTRIDWKETPEAHVFKVDLPGFKKEEVKVETEDNRVLRISGQRKVEKEDKNDEWHRSERSSGSFTRRFKLPQTAKLHRVKAALENGVLTVTIPKEKKPEIGHVEISDNNNTRIDWKETPEAHVFKVDLPGFKKEEVKVETEDNRVLRISGQRKVEKEDKNDKWHRSERSSGSFTRRFKLPQTAKLHRVKTALENGVLTVTVPKEKKPEIGPVEISDNNGNWHLEERSRRSYIWTFKLPKNVKLGRVKAENGVLSVTVLKEEVKNRKSVENSVKKDEWHFKLPKNAELDLAKAEHGILTVIVPKEEVKNPKVKSVKFSG